MVVPMNTETITIAPALPIAGSIEIEGQRFAAVECFGSYAPLTACCGAAVTGVDEGVVCKGCFELVDERLGMSYSADELIR